MPVATPTAFTTACPRCLASRSFVNIDGGQTYRCAGCEWPFALTAGAPTAALSGAHAQGATALTLATPAVPAIPATTVAATNSNAYTILVTVSGGTMTANTQINGVSTGLTTGTFTVQPGSTITIFYSAAPGWALAAAGTLFTSGMSVLVDTGPNAEVAVAGTGATATNVPVTALLKPHVTTTPAGQLSMAPQFSQAGTEQVPARPGWGF